MLTNLLRNIMKESFDSATLANTVVSFEEHSIHQGDHYNYCDYALNQASAATIEFIFTTPNTTEWSHLSFGVSASTGATIELYEGTNTVVGGTAITPRNNNRNSTKTSSVTIIKDPTSLVDGTRASGYVAGGGRTAGVVSREKEFILKQNTSYLVRITSLAVANDIAWCADWYEYTSK